MNELTNAAKATLPAHAHDHAHTHTGEHEGQGSGLAQAGRFLRHFLEMVFAMMLGMAVWGVIVAVFLRPIGYSDVARAYPELRFGMMAVFMSIPMVWLMRYRKHTWERSTEMVLSMVAPMAALVLCWRLGMGDYVPFLSGQALSASSHVAMILGMLVLMLYRRREYSHVHNAPHMPSAHAAP